MWGGPQKPSKLKRTATPAATVWHSHASHSIAASGCTRHSRLYYCYCLAAILTLDSFLHYTFDTAAALLSSPLSTGNCSLPGSVSDRNARGTSHRTKEKQGNQDKGITCSLRKLVSKNCTKGNRCRIALQATVFRTSLHFRRPRGLVGEVEVRLVSS